VLYCLVVFVTHVLLIFQFYQYLLILKVHFIKYLVCNLIEGWSSKSYVFDLGMYTCFYNTWQTKTRSLRSRGI